MKGVAQFAVTFGLLFLLLIASATALPTPPPAPGDPVPAGSNAITISAPKDGAFFKETRVNFSLSSVEAATNCSLILNGSVVKTWTPAGASEALAYTKTSLANGVYSWSALCVQESGPTVESDLRTFTIDTAAPAISLDSDSIEQGEFLLVNGSHYLPGDVSLNLTNETGGVINQATVDVVSDGHFGSNVFFKYSFLPGTYTISTWQEGFAGSWKSASVTLTKRAVNILTDKESYKAGDTIAIYGAGFSSLATVTITFKKPDGGEFLKTVASLGNGSFTTTYALTGIRAAGTYKVVATDTAGLSATTTFTIVDANGPILLPPCAAPNKCLASQPTNGLLQSSYNCTVSNYCYSCSPGYHWDGNLCAQDTTCTPTCASGAWQCVGSQIQWCASVNSCWLWGSGESCPEGQECQEGKGCAEKVVIPNIDDPNPPVTQKPSGAGLSLLWISLLVVLLIVLGTGAYLVYDGKLDLHDLGGSLKALLHPETKSASGTASLASGSETFEEVSHYIFSERSQGYDDLTIRNALIDRGWTQNDVDTVFQQIYAQ